MKKSMSGNTLTFSFDGDLPAVTCDVTKVSEDIKHYAMMDRLMSRIGDTAAIPKLQPDGSVITVTEAMRRDKVAEMAAHLESGTTQWNLKAGPRAAPQNAAILKLAQAMGKSYAEAEAWIAQKALEELSA